MCIKIKCKVCGDIFESASIARKVCDKPECRVRRRDTRTKILLCKECGGVIPVGSGRRYYCSEICNRIATRRYHAEYSSIKINPHSRNDDRPNCPVCGSNHINKYGVRSGLPRWFCVPCRRAFVEEVKAEIEYKTIGEVATGLSYV